MEMHRFLLRLPRVVFDELSDAAHRNRRSVNSEILLRLSRPGVEPVGRRLVREVRPDFKR